MASISSSRSPAAPIRRIRSSSATVSAAADAPWTTLIGDFDNEFGFVGNDGDEVLLPHRSRRADEADRGDGHRASRAASTSPKSSAREGDARRRQHDGRQSDPAVHGRRRSPTSRCSTSTGKPLGDVTLPGIGTVDGFGGDQDDKETFFVFTSYNDADERLPLRCAGRTRSELVRAAEGEVRPGRLTSSSKCSTKQRRHPRADDARLPQGSAKLDGHSRRCSTATAASTSRSRPRSRLEYIAWMELGGVLAVANLRGGGEYGEDWHLAGKTAQEAERVRRLHRRRRVADREKRTTPRQARHHGRQQRRPPGRRRR